MTDPPKPRIVMDVCRDGWTKGLQVGISALDANGGGRGFRIAGPKYNGSQERLLSTDLDERDAREIRKYLDEAFPPDTTALAAEVERLHEAKDQIMGRLDEAQRAYVFDTAELKRENARLRAELAARPSSAEALRDAGDRIGRRADALGGKWVQAAEVRTVLNTLADAAERTPCNGPVVCEDGGEPCDRHEREQSHAEGEHELCGAECNATAPAPLRWGLDDVEWGDDDSVTLLLSGPAGEPYVLELDADRAKVLRRDLDGPNLRCEDAGEGMSGPCDCGEGAVHYTTNACPAEQRAAEGKRQAEVWQDALRCPHCGATTESCGVCGMQIGDTTVPAQGGDPS